MITISFTGPVTGYDDNSLKDVRVILKTLLAEHGHNIRLEMTGVNGSEERVLYMARSCGIPSMFIRAASQKLDYLPDWLSSYVTYLDDSGDELVHKKSIMQSALMNIILLPDPIFRKCSFSVKTLEWAINHEVPVAVLGSNHLILSSKDSHDLFLIKKYLDA